VLRIGIIITSVGDVIDSVSDDDDVACRLTQRSF